MLRAHLAALAALILAACGPTWTVIKQPEANPFRDQLRYALAVDLSQMTYDGQTEAVFVTNSKHGKPGWTATQEAFLGGFVPVFREKAAAEGLTIVDEGGTAPYLLKVVVGDVVPGRGFGGESLTPITVQLLLDGAVLEEVRMAHETAGGTPYPSPDKRIHADGRTLGKWVARYLASRARE
ncbi:MAG: hypothetical protein QM765_30870 [Myxococcales bacterium]